MADAADVRSIAALRDWYAALTAYGESLAEAQAGVELELRRSFEWLAEQQALWQRAARECYDEVIRAKAELATRKFPDYSGREPDTTVQERALRLAKARLEHAEDQVVKIRGWIGRLPKLIEEVYRGAATRLRNLLEGDLPKGLAILSRRIAALESYADLRPDYAPTPSANSVRPASSPKPPITTTTDTPPSPPPPEPPS